MVRLISVVIKETTPEVSSLKFITENDICLMNDKPYTHIHSSTYSFSSIDLLLSHSSHFLDFNWSVCEDQHHSDH